MRRGVTLLALVTAASTLLLVPLAGAIAPSVSITSGPSGVVASSSATFQFTVDDPAAAVECSLDGGGFSACSSGVGYSGLGDGSHTFTLRATNAEAETGSDSRSWTVDTTGPSLSLPNMTVDINAATSTTVNYTSASASDPSTPVTLTCSPLSGSTFSLGTSTVSCSATDGLGNGSAGSFIVTVRDITDPVVTVPDNQTVNINGATTAVVTWSGVSSNEGTPTCSPASGSSFPLGATTVTCTATDAAGNTGSGSFDVVVQDTTAPVLTLPGTQTRNVNGVTSVAVTFTVSATDGPTALTPTCLPPSGSAFPLGTTTVTCTATDAAGNTASGTFNVVVQDTTPPTVTIGGGPSGTVASASASFSFSTSEGSLACQLDGGAFSACTSPATFGGLADGGHTFTARGTDPAGNTASASRSWSVDTAPPLITTPGPLVVEANGPGGSLVGYVVTASDNGLALLPSAIACTPPSGALFALGTTTVTCTATDALGNAGSAQFDVAVRDTTRPTLNAPDVTLAATSEAGIRRTDPALAAYLRGISASDLVSGSARIVTDTPDLLPVGVTRLRVTASDGAGNEATRAVTITVLPLGQKAPPPPDLEPPRDVASVRAKAGDHRVDLTWVLPRSGVVAVEVRMSVAGAQGGERVVFRGLSSRTTVKGLRNDVQHRFLLVTLDEAENRSRGAVVLATPEARLLASPKAGARVERAPLLRWSRIPGASYFNVQLFLGRVKVLSVWPASARFQLTPAWVYQKVKRVLKPGIYTWYVWPGLGDRAETRYGPLLGKSTFVVVPRRKPTTAPRAAAVVHLSPQPTSVGSQRHRQPVAPG